MEENMTLKSLSFTKIATEPQNAGFDWFADSALDIDDPVVSDAIPSPFCRLELVDNALKWVNQKFEQAGTDRTRQEKALGVVSPNDYHKIISECLDVGMMFCYKNMFFDKCKKIPVNTNFTDKWNEIEKRYKELIKRQNNNTLTPEQQSELEAIAGKIRFYTALRIFENDDEVFAAKMNKMICLQWENVVVGATSPVSLFVAAKGVKARLLEECRHNYGCTQDDDRTIMDKYFPKFENYILFNDTNKPLFERSLDFQQFIYDNAYTISGMKSFIEYINNCLRYKNPLNLQQLQEQGQDNGNQNGNKHNYTEVPIFEDSNDPQNTKYLKKTLTSDDLFETSILGSSFPIDSNKFICLNGNESEKYFLPLREEFFNTFGKDAVKDISFIYENTPVNNRDNETITITYQDRNKVFKKIYKNDDRNGFGTIKSLQNAELLLSFFPFVEPTARLEGKVAIYSVNCDVNAEFYSCQQKQSLRGVNFQKYVDYGDNKISKHCTLTETYDCIKLLIKETGNPSPYSVFVVPVLENCEQPNPRDAELFDFSVDIGTTNTYVSYKTNRITEPQIFDLFKWNKKLFVNLYKEHWEEEDEKTKIISSKYLVREQALEFGKLAALEFVPPEDLGEDANGNKIKVKFPLRTAIWEHSNKSEFDFIYGTVLGHEYPNLSLKKNFKWGTEAKDCFKKAIYSLAELIDKFVKVNGGKLNSLTSFYPVSMDANLKQDVSFEWRNWCNHREVNFRWVSESEAPMLFERNRQGQQGHQADLRRTGITIDIGGGSTDMAFYDMSGALQAVTSMEFAGNDVFANLNPINVAAHIIRVGNRYSIAAYTRTKGYEEYEYDTNFNKFVNENPDFAEANSLLFSVSSDDNPVNYSRDLHDNRRFLVIVYYFYAAILYHAISIFNKKGFPGIPYSIVFSGNGSKILSLINAEDLHRFTIKFIKKYLGLDGQQNNGEDVVTIRLAASPKVVTAQGGLYAPDNSDQELEIVLFPGEEIVTVTNLNMTFANAEKNEVKTACFTEVQKFNTMFFEVMGEILRAARNENGADFLKRVVDQLNATRNSTARTNFEDGYEEYLGEVKEIARQTAEQFDDKVNHLSQTTFFFPIKYIICRALESVERNTGGSNGQIRTR